MTATNLNSLTFEEKIRLLPEKDQWYLMGYVDKALSLLNLLNCLEVAQTCKKAVNVVHIYDGKEVSPWSFSL